jgi:predicted ATPase/class 3 adenylate cyclase/regulation of enolase protein 1 (concanavalin A-like superfamily)
LSGERKQATVLLADVKGSTALAEQVDTETWVEIMNQVFQILGAEVYRYGGQIDQYRGDGLVAFFGVPTGHEDDPERAVRAALDMQTAIARYAAELAERRVPDGKTGIELLLRVGLNTGEVIAARVGNREQHTEETAMGRAIALAARMESAAEPGTVLVTESTYHLTQTLFDWRALGQIRVKGVSQPQTVYRPIAARNVPRTGRGPSELASPLVGREAESRTMLEAVERLRDGMGGIVTVVGDAGIGKSRLVAETRGAPAAARVQWVEGRCHSYTSHVAYGLWADMMRSLLDVPGEAPARAVRDTLERWVRAEYADNFDQVYPFLGRLLAVPLDDRTEAVLQGLGAEGIRIGTFRAVETAVERAARSHPLVIVCEDLHWADPTSLDLLKHLLALSDRVPLLIVCLLRPETGHGCWEVRETAARHYPHRHSDLWLAPLPDGESERLVGNLLFSISDAGAEAEPKSRAELDPALRARIIRHSDGNPFYLEEILRSLVESGAIVCDLDACRWDAADDASAVVIPDTLHGVLGARIDRLPQETRRVLQWASVIGRVFSYRVLAAVTEDLALARGAQGSALEGHLVVLLREQMIRERGRVPEREYVFKHVLTQEAAYNSLLKRECRTIHKRVAQALEQLSPDRLDEQLSLLAYHWEHADEPEQAIPYLLRAGEQARVAHANEEAIAHLRRALHLLDDVPSHVDRARTGTWRLEALRGLGQIHESLSQLDRAEHYLRQAIALGREQGLEPRALVRLYHWLGEVVYWEQRIDERIRIGREGLALLGDDLESVEGALMNQTLAMGLRAIGEYGEFLALTRRTAALIERVPHVKELRPAYRHVADMYVMEKEVEKAIAWQQVFEERAIADHDTRSLLEAQMLAAELRAFTGDLRGAVSRFEQAHEIALRIGDRRHLHWVPFFTQYMLWKQGDLDDASAQARTSIEMVQSVEDMPTARMALFMVAGLVYLARGEREEAEELLQEAVRLVPQTTDWNFIKLGALHALGRTYLASGKHTEARQPFSQAITLLRSGLAPYHNRELAELLSGLESTETDAAAYQAHCRRLRAEHPQFDELSFQWWCLEPAQPQTPDPPCVQEGFATVLGPEWTWTDPLGDGTFFVQEGLEIRAANGRDLWVLNQSAPRMLRPASGEFGVQAICAPGTDDLPAIGGLLIWRDRANYLRLDRGLTGDRDVTLLGCVENRDQVIGRGRLPGQVARGGDRIWLRLERVGEQVTAFCSADGKAWFTLGHVPFAVQDPLQVGVYASGDINRTIYQGDHPDGTAIRFESFELWRGSG